MNDDETQCCQCENWYYPEDMFERDGELYCDWCYEREEPCYGCEKIFPSTEMFNPVQDKYFCVDCNTDMCLTCKQFVPSKQMVWKQGNWSCDGCATKVNQKKKLVMKCLKCEQKKPVSCFNGKTMICDNCNC
jgi:hypothetical protein